MRIGWAGAVVAAMVLASPAAAKIDMNFVGCDGYDAPKKTADGMNTIRGFLGDTATSSARAGRYALGEAGLTACDTALADPRLLPEFWARRAHIYQARALHDIAANKFDEALKQLDLSDKEGAGHNDPWFDDSIGLSNRMIRSVALYRLDRKDEARKMLEAAAASRPYAPSIAGLARSIEMLYEYDRKNFTRLMTEGVPLAPTLVRALFWTAIFHDDYAAAEKLSGQISFELPKGHGSWRLVGESTYEYDLIKERAMLAGGLAYAKLALGKTDEARKLIADARDDITDAIEPPQPGPDAKEPSKSQLRDWEARKRAGDAATRELDSWERSLDLREKVKGKSFAEASTIVSANGGGEPTILTDVLRQVKPANDAERDKIASLLQKMDDGKDLTRRKSFALNLSQLVERLPRPETIAMRPKMQREGIGILRNDANGFAVKPDAATGLTTIRFGSTEAPRPMVEEAALLKAAQYARSEGKDAFIITAAQSIQRTTTIYGMYTRGGTFDSGYEARLMIRPVDSAKLPTELEVQRWRLIKADAVIAKLGPKYLTADAEK